MLKLAAWKKYACKKYFLQAGSYRLGLLILNSAVEARSTQLSGQDELVKVKHWVTLHKQQARLSLSTSQISTPVPTTNPLFHLNGLSSTIYMIKPNIDGSETFLKILRHAATLLWLLPQLTVENLKTSVSSSNIINLIILRIKILKLTCSVVLCFLLFMFGVTHLHTLCPSRSGAAASEHSSFTWRALYSENWRRPPASVLPLIPTAFTKCFL